MTFNLQDLFSCLLLSECVYKATDQGPEAALAALQSFQQQFPTGFVPLSHVHFCRKSVAHRYMLSTGDGALYVAFQGTKELRDVVSDITITSRALWGDGLGADASIDLDGSGSGGFLNGEVPAVHAGFLSRSHGIPIEALYLHAQRQELRLVLCG